MANKSSKTLARTNLATLNRTHLTTLSIHLIFILYRLLFLRGSVYKYVLLVLPSLLIEAYLDRLGRPGYGANGDLLRPGEDLAAQGVTEYLWDIVYATWIVLGLVGLLGEWAWWVALVVPAYAAYLAWGLYKGFVGGGMPGMPKVEEQPAQGASKRQQKVEARGGQKVRYR
ncbi:hypothetical protein FN846DRAFT_893048 [Sphaerosporella brunnea]|uniref:DUF788 domain protein n=1 Tax=Sphaerosporella brunnea TaxID=1250544 RepID=A0A5J5ENM2_9PEZI|nr:hypothetical protein FN846DRAFT_893048 [Sphaerosporella brunnea]